MYNTTYTVLFTSTDALELSHRQEESFIGVNARGGILQDTTGKNRQQQGVRPPVTRKK